MAHNWPITPATWPDGRVPGVGAEVTIARDMAVVLDVAPPALRSLTIDGKLTFSDDRDIGLETDWIYLRGGELAIGSEAQPYRHNATITKLMMSFSSSPIFTFPSVHSLKSMFGVM